MRKLPTRKTSSLFRSPRLVVLVLLTLSIAFPVVIAINRSARVSRKPQVSSRNGSTKRKSKALRMARLFLPEVGNDTSPRLRDMVQVPITSNEIGFRQSRTRAQEATTARIDSGAILIAGISLDDNGEVGATQRVKIVNKGYQIFDNLTGTSVLGPSDISTIWAGFGGSCESGGAGDAVVLYDKRADRWVISQFGSATGGGAVTEECFAVSTTSDATGSYHRYAFHLGTNFIDSPHLSIQPDGYLMGGGVYDESGTERLGTQLFVFDRTAMLTGSAATLTTPGLDTGVGETYSISADAVRLVSGPISPTVSTLTINLTYDPDSTFTSAGLSAADIVNMKAANVFAASQFTNNFNDPFNVNIRVTAVPGTNTLGMSSTSLFSQAFTTGIRDPTRADATTTDDATMAGAGGSVPAALTDPIGGTHNWWVAKAQRKALSIVADDLTQDGTYTFGGGQPYTYDPNNRAVAGKYDYIGVSMHEFSEIMGRIPGLGTTAINGSPAYLQMDLFHYTGANTRGLTNGAGRSFSFNNGTSLLKAFNNAAADPGTDSQDWASGTNDSFNARSSPGVKNDLTAVDLQVMDVIGYNKIAGGGTPPANDNFANAQAIGGSSGSVSGTNISATKETGEPQHAGNAGGASVWYQWQAPASGSVTISTSGSSYDTLLGVYTGTSVSSLTTIASNDDENYPTILTSTVIFNALSGTTYRIAVDGFGSASGNVTLNWSLSTTGLRIDSVVPPAGRTSGGQQIILNGSFAGLSTVTMGGSSASWSYTNGSGDTSRITVTTPGHAVGAVTITLTPTFGNPYSKANAFAYLPKVFTDDTITVGQTTAKAQHIIELRQAVDALRAVAGLSGAPWTDPALTAGNTIKAAHILDLRTFLNDAANRLGFATSGYTDPTLSAGFLVKRVHIEELRQRIRVIAG
jgi:hypothetical protein